MVTANRPDGFARVDYTCTKYKPGHQVHWIQARLAREAEAREPKLVESVDGDGTIRFTDGTTKWNHDVRRVRELVDVLGPDAVLRDHHVLAIGSYLVCVADEPDSCDSRERLPGETLTDELACRGGVMRPIRDLLDDR